MDRIGPAEVNAVRRDVAQGLVISLGVVPPNKGGDLTLELHRCLVDIQVYVLFSVAMIPLNLPVGLRRRLRDAKVTFILDFIG